MKQINKLVAQAQQHNGLIEAIRQDVSRLLENLVANNTELERINKRHGDMVWSYQYLDTLVKTESNRFISRLEELLNYGVSVIFNDRDYRLKIVIEEDKRASIHLLFTDEDGNEISPDIRDCGGGIRTVIAVIMQIFFLFHYQVEKVLIIDEGLSQISSEYLPNLFSLLDEIARNNGLKILLITHDSRMMEYATNTYVVDNHEARKVKYDYN